MDVDSGEGGSALFNKRYCLMDWLNFTYEALFLEGM